MRSRRHWGRRSVRLRLTLAYSALFFLAAAGLLAANYFLVSRSAHTSGTFTAIICKANRGSGASSGSASGAGQVAGFVVGGAPPLPALPANCVQQTTTVATGGVAGSGGPSATEPATKPGQPPSAAAGQVPPSVSYLRRVVSASQDRTLGSLAADSGIALAVMAALSLGLGWLIAGRALRPVHRITGTARRLSEETLHERIALEGPADELKELADTFDGMLDRLQAAFASQQRFVANASHELRTPLATERVLIDEALANRGASKAELRSTLEQLRTTSEETDRLIDALLALARSERGIEQRQIVDLAAAASRCADRAASEGLVRGIRVDVELSPAATSGDPALVERLIANLCDNAVRHNVAGGWVTVATRTEAGQGVLEVVNSGLVLDPAAVPHLFEPFRRYQADRTSDAEGFGLGLSIVSAVVAAHGAQLAVDARAEGGLHVTVRFAPVGASAPEAIREPDRGGLTSAGSTKPF
jgi:signal transduction histidine kinase